MDSQTGGSQVISWVRGDKMKVCIVGGVAGGATVAARLRRLDEDAEIIIFERGQYISYANCGLPYYLGGEIQHRRDLFVQTPKRFKSRLNVEARVNSEVILINREQKSITVKNHETGASYIERYDKLVLSPGAEPLRPPIPGIESEGIFTLRNVPDMDRIEEFVKTREPERAVIVGAGFIGLEMAENLHKRGIQITIVEMEEQVMNVLDFEMAAEVHQHLKSKNVEFYLGDGVAAFEQTKGKLQVILKSGRRLSVDMALLSIGVRPEGSLAAECGLAVGQRGAIVVDSFLRTQDPDIYAVGDAIEFPHPISGNPVSIPLAWPANFQGRIVADNIAGIKEKEYRGTYGTAIAKVFDLTVGITGLSEKQLKALGLPYQVAIVHSSSHAGYYPGAKPISIKVLFDPDRCNLLGAQVVGYEGVDKRLDVLSAFLVSDGQVCQLAFLEHAYAPPYSSAKDPVNVAGYIAENIISGLSRHMQWHELVKADTGRHFLLDVRTEGEHYLGSIEGSVNIPVDDLRERLDEVPKGREIVVFCQVGQRAYFAERILRQNGYDEVHNLSGGYETYSMVMQKQSNEDIFENDFIDIDDTIYGKKPD